MFQEPSSGVERLSSLIWPCLCASLNNTIFLITFVTTYRSLSALVSRPPSSSSLASMTLPLGAAIGSSGIEAPAVAGAVAAGGGIGPSLYQQLQQGSGGGSGGRALGPGEMRAAEELCQGGGDLFGTHLDGSSCGSPTNRCEAVVWGWGG